MNGGVASAGNLGIKNGRLAPCPATPNCVCSQCSSDDAHFVEPVTYSVPTETLMELVSAVLKETPRTNIIAASEKYIHAEATTLIFRFTDDFELYVDAGQKQLHFRSASRVGRSDFGTNRRRVEVFKQEFEKKLSKL